MQIPLPLRAAAAATLASLSFPAFALGAQEPEPPGKALFLQHCATCHGETGDGDGVTELDRPARSFRDGGFSFGNTPEALFRTISTGIPGTPMPGFDTAIDESGRRALAEYVRSLGPPVEEVDDAAAILRVTDRARIVRGHLPAIAEDAPSRPRGLLIGTTSGLTFEYRADDVRLLGVRLGDFVKRSDWTGRGGTPLEPLGPVVHVLQGGDPPPPFRLEGSKAPALVCKLRSTWVRGREAGIDYAWFAEGEAREAPLGRVTESVEAVVGARATGFRRRFHVEVGADPAERSDARPRRVIADLLNPIGPPFDTQLTRGSGRAQVFTFRDGNGVVQVSALVGDGLEGGDGTARFEAGSEGTVEVTTLLCTPWDAETEAAVQEALAR